MSDGAPRLGRVVCGLLYWSGIGPLWYRVRRARAPGAWTILAYHRVGSPSRNGGPVAVDPRRFRRHLRYLKRRYEIVPVGEALARRAARAGVGRPMLSLTFDDGYRDNVTAALPILQEEGCRATLYVTVEAVRDGLAPWTHRLAADLRALASAAAVRPREEPIDPALREFASAVRTGEIALRDALRALLDRVKGLPRAERAALCDEASRISGGAGMSGAEMVRAEDLARWHAAGMEVGSHTVSHPILARLPAAERQEELRESRRWLASRLGFAIDHLAYPNGGREDWDDATAADARQAGYLSAVTTVPEVQRGSHDPYRLPRISVGDDSLPVLAARASGLLAGFGARRRAPDPAAGAAPDVPRTRLSAAPRGGVPAGGRRLGIAFIGGRGVGSAYSGIERYYEEVGSRLAARGHRVLIYSRPHFDPRVRVFRGMEIRKLPTLRAKHLETLVHSILATLDVCFRRVDIVQYHALGSSPLAWLPRIAGKKTVVSVRGLDWQRAKWGWLARTYLRFCERTSVSCPNATAVVSRTLKRHFESRFVRTVRYIPNGVGEMAGVPPEIIRSWGLDRRNYLLYAGRLSPEKGLDHLIEAHAGVADACLLVLAGGSSYSEKYVAHLKSRTGPRVIFTGFLTGRALQELYSNALAFVLPSHMEGLSVALLEALSYGLPVVASDIPENRELVEECGGHLFRLHDVGSLRAALETIVRDPEAARRLGEKARELVSARYGWDRIASETVRFYREVIDGSGSGQAPAASEARASCPGAGAYGRRDGG